MATDITYRLADWTDTRLLARAATHTAGAGHTITVTGVTAELVGDRYGVCCLPTDPSAAPVYRTDWSAAVRWLLRYDRRAIRH